MEKTKSYLTNEEDILISMTGSNVNQPDSIVGRVALVTKYDKKFLINQRVGRLAFINPSKINSKYLFYVLSQKENQYYLALNASGSANQVNINSKLIESIKIRDVSFNDSNKIAHILSTLDNKIELNKKINHTLESITQAIFKSWFLDFDPIHAKANANSDDEYEGIAKELGISTEILDLFPSEFEHSELGLIPKGWHIRKLEDLADVVGGGTPSTSEKKYYCKAGSGISWLSPKDLSGYPWKYISTGSTDITDLGLKKSSARMLPKDTVLFSSRAPIGYMAIAEKAVCTNQGFKSLIPKNSENTEFLYFLVKNNLASIEANATGSTFKEISGAGMKQLSVICPSEVLILSFKRAVFEFFMHQKALRHETNSLIKIRDTLLPKLLSGEIDVSNLNLEPDYD